MRFVIDNRTVPPLARLEEPKAFDSFSVSIRVPQHVWIDREAVVELAGDVVDIAWLEQLDAMIGYAERKGWLDAHGRIRAHVTLESLAGR